MEMCGEWKQKNIFYKKIRRSYEYKEKGSKG